MALYPAIFCCPILLCLFVVALASTTDNEILEDTANSTTITVNSSSAASKSEQELDDILADEILEEVRRQVNVSDVEPLPVGDVSFLRGGRFRGLASIRRLGHARRQGNESLEIPAVFDKTEIKFNWTFSLLFTKASGIATVRATQMPIILYVRLSHHRSAQLDICDVPHMKGLTVQVSGAGNLNFLTSRVAAIALGLTRSSLTRSLQDPVCAFLAGVL